jgi:YVTN family beta-propeller protein
MCEMILQSATHIVGTRKVDMPIASCFSPRLYRGIRVRQALAEIAALLALAMLLPNGEAAEMQSSERVGRVSPTRIVTPMNQVLTPFGRQVDLPGMRPQAIALSPDGEILVTAGKTAELVVVSPELGTVLQRIPLPAEDANAATSEPVSTHILKPDEEGQLSYTGLIFSPDGSRLYLANVNGSIKVFSADRQHKVAGVGSFPLPSANAPRRKAEIPAGLAVSADGRRLYVALNLSNQLAELDAETGKVLRLWATGVAPYTVALARKKAYVSNWGGRRPDADSLTGPAGQGTKVRVDGKRFIACEGSVTVVDLADNKVRTEILTGLHASGLSVSPNGKYLAVANAGSDTVSVIDTRTDEVVETIWTRQSPADLFGASPNALVFDRSGRTLFVCNGTQNAVAVIVFAPGRSQLKGLVPVGWFPGALVHDAKRKALYVANIKGIGPGSQRANGQPEFATKQYFGSLSLVPEVGAKHLAELTRQALANMRYPLLAQSRLKPRPGEPQRPVPERVGEPSVFKHVIYIIKENRTYDQVLGDMKEGNGDPELCVFGETVTPNQHKLAREFVLLDNTYCSALLSADGHQWTDSAFATDYMEKSFAGFPRSYPDGMEDADVDALAYSPAGFIWDNAIAGGKTLRVFGEFGIAEKSWVDKSRAGRPNFLDHYREFVNGTAMINLSSRPGIESLRPYLVTNTVGWDLDVPDVFRASQFIKELQQCEQSGRFPNLSILLLPNDHTSGTRPGAPTPAAQMADNDLALGRIIEAVGRSRYWKETCVFVIEDDPQDGWDHVSGYRTIALVVSPFTRRGGVVSTQYNQTSVIRTTELILGLPPMNQMDSTATPMFDCFTNIPDFTPFAAVTNNIPLDQMNPEPKRVSDPLLRKNAYASARLPLEKPDQCSEDQLNRILWHAMKGSRTPYPAWAVRLTDED